MSYGGYQQYGGNPYGGSGGQAGYGQSNPYASEDYGQDVEQGVYGAGSNPYGQTTAQPTVSGSPIYVPDIKTYADLRSRHGLNLLRSTPTHNTRELRAKTQWVQQAQHHTATRNSRQWLRNSRPS